jgi:hypothetical protein
MLFFVLAPGCTAAWCLAGCKTSAAKHLLFVSYGTHTISQHIPLLAAAAAACYNQFPAGGLVLGCITGHVLMGQALPDGGYSNWQLLAKLPTAVHSMCMTQEGATPASIQRA